ncbi:MAG: hypothetical protein ACQEV6_17405 [Pseudomonadota bacterium]
MIDEKAWSESFGPFCWGRRNRLTASLLQERDRFVITPHSAELLVPALQTAVFRSIFYGYFGDYWNNEA